MNSSNTCKRACAHSALLLLLWVTSAGACTQQNHPVPGEQSKSQPQVSAPDESLPRVSFVFDHPQVPPNHFEMVVDSLGRGSYASHSELKADEPEAIAAKNEDLEKTFTLSPSTRDRIFELARATRYFNGSFDYTKSRVAFTGKKTLSYIHKEQAHSTTFNWSENQSIEELAAIFLGISYTLESGVRLEQLLQHEKLALNGELTRLEQSSKNRQTKEMQLIREVLLRIANDPSVMVVARRRAERLLQGASR